MLTRLKDILLDPLWWKLAAVFAGYFFAVVNLLVDPADIATLPDDASPYHASRVKAGGFALITAIALFVALISRGTDKRDTLIEGMAQLLGVLAACGAGWYVLDSETQGNPGLYIVGIVTFNRAHCYSRGDCGWVLGCARRRTESRNPALQNYRTVRWQITQKGGNRRLTLRSVARHSCPTPPC